MKTKEIKVIKELKLDNVLIPIGKELTGFKDEKDYKIFHHTGWWSVPNEYFE